MRRAKQRRIKQEVSGRSEQRRVRRGREVSAASGTGHGQRVKQDVRQTNHVMTRKERDALPAKQANSALKKIMGW